MATVYETRTANYYQSTTVMTAGDLARESARVTLTVIDGVAKRALARLSGS